MSRTDRYGWTCWKPLQSPFQPGGPNIVVYQRLDMSTALRR